MSAYVYRGDRWTRPELRGAVCFAEVRPDGKTVRGRNGNMLVNFDCGKVVVLARLLRRIR